jgi:hypothetical protein
MQAAAGRVIMSVDSTHLLNLKHVYETDDQWRFPASGADDMLPFDAVRTYGTIPPVEPVEGSPKTLAIVTYGNGVIAALQAQQELAKEHNLTAITVIDCPLLSGVPSELGALLPRSVDDCNICW